MAVEAWTQQFGSHTKIGYADNTWSSQHRERYRGEYTPWVYEHGLGRGGFYSSNHARRDKYTGDRWHPLPYRRDIANIVIDEPYGHTSTTYDGYGEIIDITKEVKYISIETDIAHEPETGRLGDVEGEAITKALNNLGDVKSALGSNIVQARQTVDQFANAASRGARFLLALKHGNIGAAAKQLGQSLKHTRFKNVADAWLELSYGWRPFASDLYGLGEAVGIHLSQPTEMYAKGKAEYSWDYSEGLFSKFTSEYQLARKVECRLRAKVANESLRFLNQIGLTNPAAIAWDVLPWSFALDWFMPVGNYLEAATAAYGLDFSRGSVTTTDAYQVDITLSTLWAFFSGLEVTSNGHTRAEYYHQRRVPLGDFPRPRIYSNMRPYSTDRALNALALVRQLRK